MQYSLESNPFKGNAEEWDGLCAACEFSDVHQSWAWGESVKHFGWGIERLLFQKGGTLVGLSSVHVKRKMGFAFHYLPRGPLLDYRDESLLSEVLCVLKQQYRRSVYVKINPNVSFSENRQKIILSAGFVPATRRDFFDATIMVDLTKDEDILWQGLRDSNRSYIKKAAGDLEVREVEDSAVELRNFSLLYEKMALKKNISPISGEFFGKLRDSLRGSDFFKLRAAYKDKQMLAASILFCDRKSMLYKWGASIPSGECGYYASHLLHWDNIMWGKKSGRRYYDLGGCDSAGSQGVRTFKEGFGGDFVTLLGEYDHVNRPILYRLAHRK